MRLETTVITYSPGIAFIGTIVVFVVKVADLLVKVADKKINDFVESLPLIDKIIDGITKITGAG